MRKQFSQFLRYIKLLAKSIVFWLSLLMTFGDFVTGYLIPYFNLNIQFQLLFNILAILGIVGVLWSGFQIYKEKQQQNFEPIKSIKLFLVEGREYTFEIDDRIAMLSGEDEFPALPPLILTLNGKIENDGDIPVSVIDINAGIELRRGSSKNHKYDFSKIEKLKPFTITKFRTILSHNKDYPIHLYAGDKIHFSFRAEVLVQSYTSDLGHFVEYNPAQVATYIRNMMLKKVGTDITVWAEFDEIDRVSKPEIVKNIKYIKFDQLYDCLTNYWKEHQMLELVKQSQTRKKAA